MSVVVKPSDETISSNATLQNDDALLFAVGANEKWQFEGFLRWTTTAAADFKLQFTGPSGSVGFYTIEEITGGIGNGGSELNSPLTYTAASGSAFFRGAIANGGTAGNLQLQWAQNTSDASNTTVHAGSYLKYLQQV